MALKSVVSNIPLLPAPLNQVSPQTRSAFHACIQGSRFPKFPSSIPVKILYPHSISSAKLPPKNTAPAPNTTAGSSSCPDGAGSIPKVISAELTTKLTDRIAAAYQSPGSLTLPQITKQLLANDSERTVRNFVGALDGYMKTRGRRHRREEEIVTEMLLLLNVASCNFVLELAKRNVLQKGRLHTIVTCKHKTVSILILIGSIFI